MRESISNKIALLNQATLESFLDTDSAKIVEHFTEIGIKLLEADFGFAWWKTINAKDYHLIYKSENTPYNPKPPRQEGGNFKASKTRLPFFVASVKSEKYSKEFDVSSYMQSYVIIPIAYKKDIYGSLVICFKKEQNFSEEMRELATALGRTTAQSITIFRLKNKEKEVLAKAAQQEADLREEQLRTEFIANASHEIRTPLAIIRGNIDLVLLKNKKIPQDIVESLHIVNGEVEHLSNIITDLTFLTSKGVVLKEDIILKKVDLFSVLNSVVVRCKTLADKKKITISLSGLKNIIMVGDVECLERLFLNLVSNAIHYGKVGGFVKIKISKTGNKAKVVVSDNGVGISHDDLPHIFTRFYRVDKSHHTIGRNTGLGLAIVKWIVSAHKGSIQVGSVLGKGSDFEVILPILKLD